MTTGVLALQGAFELHQRVVESLGEKTLQVRRPDDLSRVDRLIIPGGESSTMSMLAERFGLIDALVDFARSHPILGTCAGAIMVSSEILDGRADQHALKLLDISTRRNGFGRQVESFEEGLSIPSLGSEPFPAVFIRAPVIERCGDEVEILASVSDSPALVRTGRILASTFHPELSEDSRIHELFLRL